VKYKNIIEIFKKRQNYMVTAIIIYFLGLTLGYIHQTTQSYIAIKPTDYSFTELFFHNMSSSITMILLCLISFGIISSMLLFTNGFYLGIVICNSIMQGKTPTLLTGILPHSTFELSAVFISATISYELVRLVNKIIRIKRNSKKLEYKKYLILSIKEISQLFIFSTFLLLIAATIEAYISKVIL
jgi:uncharacterized membrane protein SpoIIM required for sporulation